MYTEFSRYLYSILNFARVFPSWRVYPVTFILKSNYEKKDL
jgi:hypothetical protein